MGREIKSVWQIKEKNGERNKNCVANKRKKNGERNKNCMANKRKKMGEK